MKKILITLSFLYLSFFSLSQNSVVYQSGEALLSNVYYLNGSYYAVLDFIIIEENGMLINNNPKLRTFKLDPKSKIYTSDCSVINVDVLVTNKSFFLHQIFIYFLADKTINTLNSFYCVN